MKKIFTITILLLFISCATTTVNTKPPKPVEPTEYVEPTEPKEPVEPKELSEGTIPEMPDVQIPSVPQTKFIPYDDPPVPKTPIRPKYPESAQEAGIQGTVFVEVYIDEKGRVKETRIIKGIPELDEAATEAIHRVRFMPAKQGGSTVAARIVIPVKFSLR